MAVSRTAVCTALFFALTVAVGSVGFLARDAIQGFIASTMIYGSRAEWEFVKLREQLAKGELAETAARQQCMTIARESPASPVEVKALTFVATQWPGTDDARIARLELQRAMRLMPVGDLAGCFDTMSLGSGELWRQMADILCERVTAEPNHPRAAKLLSTASYILRPTERDDSAPEQFIRIADMIRDRYATSRDLANFCESLDANGNPAVLKRPFESHLRHIVEVNPHRMVQCSASFALATVIRSHGMERQEEAKRHYEAFLARFDGK
jgi:hypothetical protein